MLGIYPGVPAKTFKEFIALAKAKPGQLNYASGGNGNATHLGGELLKDLAGIELVHVPYKGGGPALIALVSGEVAMLFSNASFTLPQVKAGKIRALAVTGTHRSPVAPELPTVAEAGVPGFELDELPSTGSAGTREHAQGNRSEPPRRNRNRTERARVQGAACRRCK